MVSELCLGCCFESRGRMEKCYSGSWVLRGKDGCKLLMIVSSGRTY